MNLRATLEIRDEVYRRYKPIMQTELPPAACRSGLRLSLPASVVDAKAMLCFLCLMFGGCERDSFEPTIVELHGAGSTFPEPLYERWFEQMAELHPQLTITYEGVGSGAGTRQFIDEMVDFGASDDPLNNREIAQVDRGVRQIPVTSGAIVLAYHLDDANGKPVKDLHLSRDAYVGIFLGTIRSWLDEEITRHNRDVAFPDLPIQVEYRLDSSGTTSALTRHLSAISQDWKAGPGIGKSVIWPVGAGMPKGSGVIRGLKQVPGSIGYLSLTEAKTAGLSMAVLQNRAGQFVAPGLASIKNALAGFNWTGNNSGTFVNDPTGVDAYPIVIYSWLLCYQVYQDPEKLALLKELLSYGLQDGQAFSQEMGYVAIPDAVAKHGLNTLTSITLPQNADSSTSLSSRKADSPREALISPGDQIMEIDTESLETGEEAPGAGAADAEVDDVSVQRVLVEREESDLPGDDQQRSDETSTESARQGNPVP